jgi:hypothetical protein
MAEGAFIFILKLIFFQSFLRGVCYKEYEIIT